MPASPAPASGRPSGGRSPSGRTLASAVGALAAAGVATAAWSTLVEPRAFALRRVDLPVLDHGAWPIRVLHLSDLHIVPDQKYKIEWVSALADLRPDLVINTGDTLSHRKAVPTALAAFGDLLDLPGAFVFGNNDFYAPVPKSPHKYFMPKGQVARARARPALAGPAGGHGRTRLDRPEQRPDDHRTAWAAGRAGRRQRRVHPAGSLRADRGSGRPRRGAADGRDAHPRAADPGPVRP